MAWLDDRIQTHPKLVELSDRAFRAWVNTLCYCSMHGTGGRLEGAIKVHRVPKMIVRELVRAGVWDEEEGELWVHDWQVHNEKRDVALEQRRAADRERQRAHRERMRSTSRDRHVTPNVTESRDRHVTPSRDTERDGPRGRAPTRARDHDHDHDQGSRQDQEQEPRAVTSTSTPAAPDAATNGLGFTEDEQEQHRRAAELIQHVADEKDPWF